MKYLYRSVAAVVVSAALSLGLVSLSSCGSFHPSPVEGQFIDCAKVDLGKTLPEIGMTIVAYVIQIATSADPATEFARIVLHYGNDVAACAFKVAGDVLSSHPPNVAAPPPSPQAQRVQAFIAKQGWHYR